MSLNNSIDPIQFAIDTMNKTTESYFKLGDDFELYISGNRYKKCKDVATERIIDTIDKLEKEIPDNVLDIYRSSWIFIYKDILLRRRIKKIIKLKSIINTKQI